MLVNSLAGQIMHNNNSDMEKWKPGVSKTALLLIAGVMWIAVGTMLDMLSYSWLAREKMISAVIAAAIGFAGALIIHHFGFLRVVDKNLGRILPMKGKRCVFSFISWKSYALIAVMICIGIFLRHSHIPKLYLSALYIGVGTALILSSFRYLRYVIKTLKNA